VTLVGAALGSYRVTGVVGKGGMGEVYVAEHQLLGRKAAIKVLRAELSHGADAVQRFFNEARAATMIRHPGIVEIYDFGYAPDGAAFLVMELLEGESLAGRLKRDRVLPLPIALSIARQVASAIAAAHDKGIVHRHPGALRDRVEHDEHHAERLALRHVDDVEPAAVERDVADEQLRGPAGLDAVPLAAVDGDDDLAVVLDRADQPAVDGPRHQR
jgi:hypothetical protein